MHRYLMCVLSVLVVQICTTVTCKNFYSIVAPGTIKSNRNYSVCVALHEADGPCTIRVGISGSHLLNLSQEVTLQPYQTKAIDFMLPKLSKGQSFTLMAEGVSGLDFTNTTILNVDEADALKIYIQTDKGMYKPGDLVQFRVVILDEHIRPIKLVEPIKIQITDGLFNLVKQYKDIRLKKGYFTGSIQLSEQPNIGTWDIIVSISGKYASSQNKSFLVAEYVLPKFSVHIDSVSDFLLDDEVIHASVYGKYTFGKYVEGKVEVELGNNENYTKWQTQIVDIVDFKAQVKFNISALMLSGLRTIRIEATLIEKYTNYSLSTSRDIKLHKQKYHIKIPENEIEFSGNESCIMKAKVKYFNGTAVNDPRTPVYMQHGSKRYRSFLNHNGVAKFEFAYESAGTNTFYFQNATAFVPNIATDYIPNVQEQTTFCSLKVKGIGRLHVRSAVHIEVSSSSIIPYFIYMMTGHSAIIHMEYVELHGNQKSHIFIIKPSIKMVPRSTVYVHYIDNGSFHSCYVELKFSDEFENKVSVSTLKSNVEPGQTVTLNINAQPDSRVGLLAVDLSVHLLGLDFDFKKETIFAELLNDKSYTLAPLLSVGQPSDLLTMTNAHFTYTTPVRKPNADFEYIPILRNLLSNENPMDGLDIRSNFDETWIFTDIDINEEITYLSFNIPDTITTWLITAFSVNEKTGFAMMDNPLNITVFKPFFISTNFPYSIKRGETIAIPVTIFNYYAEDLSTEIVMNYRDGAFQFLNIDNSKVEDVPIIKKHICVPANGGKSVSFLLAATKVGNIDIRLSATNMIAVDAVQQQLRVEPEGILKTFNNEVYLNILDDQHFTSSIKADIPLDIIPDSEYLTLSLGGDVLVTTIEYLNDLIKLPTGCGEQNMVNFVPNILVLDYLKVIGKLEKYPDLVKTAAQFIETGYQRELTYGHETGGFSVFGRRGSESTWLTAYVMRFFIKAQKYISIDSKVIENGLKYLANQQHSDGDFPYTGHLFYPAHQNKYGFTAFVLLSFLEDRKYKKKYGNVIEKGLQFLTTNFNNVNDTYALSIMATTFLKAQKPDQASRIIQLLDTKVKEDNNRKWWSGSDNGQSNDVEITSYILLTLMESKADKHIAIFRWLIEQRNKKGGFKSTQDTVVALQAIIKFAEKYNGADTTLLKVSYSAKNQKGQEVKNGVLGVDPDNVMILQQHELPKSTRSIYFDVMGRGNSLLQFSYQYYETTKNQKDVVKTSSQNQLIDTKTLDRLDTQLEGTLAVQSRNFQLSEQSFIITPQAKMSAGNKLIVEICFKYQPKDILNYQNTNMVILEVNLPSGFMSSTDVTDELLEDDLVTRVELKNLDTTIHIYFDHLKAGDEECVHFECNKVHDVRMLKPSTITMYDYYNSNLHDTVSFEINS